MHVGTLLCYAKADKENVERSHSQIDAIRDLLVLKRMESRGELSLGRTQAPSDKTFPTDHLSMRNSTR